MTVLTLHHGDPRYAVLLDRIRADRWLTGRMWTDAESRPGELDRPGTVWCVALVDGQPAAWCAATPTGDGWLKCHSNYEHPHHRDRGLYAATYAQRHRDVVEPSGLPAVTYLFAAPIALHEADGWRRTGGEGPGEVAGNWWRELRRDAFES